jgi:hypothetical protein
MYTTRASAAKERNVIKMSDPTLFSYTVRDELGTEATAVVYANYDGSVETTDGLVGEWLALGGQIDAVTGAQIIRGVIKLPVTPSGSWKSAPASGSRVEQTGLLNFATSGSVRRNGFDFPGLKDSLISGGKIIVASGAVKALIDALVGAFTNGAFANAEGQNLTSPIDAVLSFRKRRKQLSRSSFESTVGD